jgi:ERCC4-type nuclease
MNFHNIFTSKKKKKKFSADSNLSSLDGQIGMQPKQKILVDYREKNSLVASELIKLGFEVEFRELKVADYIIRNVAIERKTISDFIGSMINKRLLRQIEELQQYENRLLIIEGIDEQELYSDENENGVNANAIRGFLLSIVLKHKVPVIFTKNADDTAKFMERIALKKEKETSIRAVKKTLNKKEQMQFILEGFQGIGPKNAKKLLKRFSTLQNIFSAPQDELKKIIGKKAEIFMLLEKKY